MLAGCRRSEDMGIGRNWTAAERDQLAEEWGRYSIPVIAERHNRTVNAILIKACKMNLGAHLDSSQYVTLNSFFKAIGISGGYTYSLGILKKAGLKIHMQKVNNNSFKMIDIDEFWIFLRMFAVSISPSSSPISF